MGAILGFRKIRGTILGVPIIRTIVYVGVYIGVPLFRETTILHDVVSSVSPSNFMARIRPFTYWFSVGTKGR